MLTSCLFEKVWVLCTVLQTILSFQVHANICISRCMNQPGTLLCICYSCSVCQLNEYLCFTCTIQCHYTFVSPAQCSDITPLFHLDNTVTSHLCFTWTRQWHHTFVSPGQYSDSTPLFHLNTPGQYNDITPLFHLDNTMTSHTNTLEYDSNNHLLCSKLIITNDENYFGSQRHAIHAEV